MVRKYSEVKLDRVKVHGSRVFAIQRGEELGTVMMLRRGLWMKLGKGSCMAMKSEGVWIGRGKTLTFLSLPD